MVMSGQLHAPATFKLFMGVGKGADPIFIWNILSYTTKPQASFPFLDKCSNISSVRCWLSCFLPRHPAPGWAVGSISTKSLNGWLRTCITVSFLAIRRAASLPVQIKQTTWFILCKPPQLWA